MDELIFELREYHYTNGNYLLEKDMATNCYRRRPFLRVAYGVTPLFDR